MTTFFPVGASNLEVTVETMYTCCTSACGSLNSSWFYILFINRVPCSGRSSSISGGGGDGRGVAISRVGGALGVYHCRSWVELAQCSRKLINVFQVLLTLNNLEKITNDLSQCHPCV